jgi:two-component system, chemotaxis family, CheB/CheR fusion protein
VVIAKDPGTGIDRWLQVHCSSQRMVGVHFDTVGLVIVDVTRYERRIAQLLQEGDKLQTSMGDQTKRAEELSARAKTMLTANEELTAVNAELRTYNEQLLINAEESASSNEEIETLNEEMQATNEELETLNEELQATVEELNTTNDELEARSAELEAANADKQAQVEKAYSQRMALTLALNNFRPASAVLNAQGEVYYISQAFAELAENDVASKGWWRAASSVEVDGEKYRTRPQRLDGGLLLVTFEKQ